YPGAGSVVTRRRTAADGVATDHLHAGLPLAAVAYAGNLGVDDVAVPAARFSHCPADPACTWATPAAAVLAGIASFLDQLPREVVCMDGAAGAQRAAETVAVRTGLGLG